MTTPKNIILTGGTGFLGSAFLQHIIKHRIDYKIFVISSGRTQFQQMKNANITYIKQDLLNNDYHDELKSVTADAIIHLATSSTLGPNFDEYTKFNNIRKIDAAILDIAQVTGCKNIIWASSGAVYGEARNETPFREIDVISLSNIAQESAYRVGKIQSEFLVTKFCEQNNLNLTILRLFTFSGTNLPLNAHFALGNFILDCLHMRNITISGNGEAVRSYLDQRDFATILHKIVELEKNLGAINVGSSTPTNIYDLANIVAKQYFKMSGNEITIHKMHKFDKKVSFYVPSIDKLLKTIGVKSLIQVEDSIADMLQFHLRNGVR